MIVSMVDCVTILYITCTGLLYFILNIQIPICFTSTLYNTLLIGRE